MKQKQKRPIDSIGLFYPLTETVLALANTEHFGAASGADTLSRGLAILHGNTLSVLHFFLGAALYTVSLHVDTSFL
jgi:hypothetical protein